MFAELSNAQSKQFLDSVSAHESLASALRQSMDYRGGMHWKKVGNKEYLYRTLDRLGNAKSCGARSPQTECIYAEFTRLKADLTERVRSLKEVSSTHARVNAAIRLGAVPNEVADVCIALNSASLFRGALTVFGTNAMYAYGYLGGVRFLGDIMATKDLDLRRTLKSKLCLAATAEVSGADLLVALRRADRSFEADTQDSFRVRSKSGVMVDLVQYMQVPPCPDDSGNFSQDDQVAKDIQGVQWLVSSPRIEQPVVSVDGRVFNMNVPDPRAFAIYKAWLSKQPTREPLKKGRDLAQARAVFSLIEQRLPHLNNWGGFRSFPQALIATAADEAPATGASAAGRPGSPRPT